MITSVRFQDFLVLKDVSLDLRRLNVLVGANGSGKSTVLEAARRLVGLAESLQADGAREAARACFGDDPRRLQRRPADAEFQLELGTEHGASWFCRGPVQSSWDRRLLTIEAELASDHGVYKTSFQPTEERETAELARRLRSLPRLSVVDLRFTREALISPFGADPTTPRLAADGIGLASVLARLYLRRDERLEEIERDLAAVVPQARRLRFDRVKRTLDSPDPRDPGREREEVGDVFELEMSGVGWVEAARLSEGTLLVLGLITLLHLEDVRLVLMDELDRALHPVAMKSLVALLRRLLERRPALQILGTTHSPYLLDFLEADEVHVLSLDGDGFATARSLAAHPLWEKRRAYLQVGEFWSSVGEGWVVESPGDV